MPAAAALLLILDALPLRPLHTSPKSASTKQRANESPWNLVLERAFQTGKPEKGLHGIEGPQPMTVPRVLRMTCPPATSLFSFPACRKVPLASSQSSKQGSGSGESPSAIRMAPLTFWNHFYSFLEICLFIESRLDMFNNIYLNS